MEHTDQSARGFADEEMLNDFLDDPQDTMIAKGRRVLTVDGARKLLTKLPQEYGMLSPELADLCRRKIEGAERFKAQLLMKDSECPDCGGLGADHHAGCESTHLTISQQAKTILADTDDALSVDINLVALTALAAERLLNGYDYTHQAWVRNGRYVRCGHPASMPCDCFGRKNAGQPLRPNAQVR